MCAAQSRETESGAVQGISCLHHGPPSGPAGANFRRHRRAGSAAKGGHLWRAEVQELILRAGPCDLQRSLQKVQSLARFSRLPASTREDAEEDIAFQLPRQLLRWSAIASRISLTPSARPLVGQRPAGVEPAVGHHCGRQAEFLCQRDPFVHPSACLIGFAPEEMNIAAVQLRQDHAERMRHSFSQRHRFLATGRAWSG